MMLKQVHSALVEEMSKGLTSVGSATKIRYEMREVNGIELEEV